jgi:hypothetical protein
MYIHHLRKSTSGAGGGMSRGCGTCGGSIIAKPHRRVIGNGITNKVYDTTLGVVKPSRVLQNIKIKKASIPKKYITFE